MTHKTKLIILKTIKYGETSLVVTAFTEKFGIQTYMVNGVRTNKKSGSKAAMYQPAAILNTEVYHNEQKNMQRIKEAEWAYLYSNVLSNVIKNSIALYMVELIYKTIKQPEENADLFAFCEDCFENLDIASNPIIANFPLFFTLHFTDFFGFKMNELSVALAAEKSIYLDLQAGYFTVEVPEHNDYLENEDARITADLLSVRQPFELEQLKLNYQKRRHLLQKYLSYYALHIQDFGKMKTLPVLQEVL